LGRGRPGVTGGMVSTIAARASDLSGFMYLGELSEIGPRGEIFTRPKDFRTED
jgi:ABC-type phosphate transport system ATPase subunit